MSQHPEILRAIQLMGSQPRLAKRAGLSQQQISKLLNHERRITAEVALALETATNGTVPRWRLRPDLWEEPVNVEKGDVH